MPWVSEVRSSAVSASSWPVHCSWSPARIRNTIIWTMELLSLLYECPWPEKCHQNNPIQYRSRTYFQKIVKFVGYIQI